MAAKVEEIISHWYHLTEGLQFSTQEFYACVEAEIRRREIPKIRLSRVSHHEAGLFSARREYLRVRRYKHIFDICAAPFGNGFFVSWWLGRAAIPLWKWFLAFYFVLPALRLLFPRQETYYELDTALMFQSSVHAVVLAMHDEITHAHGVRGPSELERKPVLGGFPPKPTRRTSLG